MRYIYTCKTVCCVALAWIIDSVYYFEYKFGVLCGMDHELVDSSARMEQRMEDVGPQQEGKGFSSIFVIRHS